ncbi:MAG: ATP-binding cassette domain-containing protein [Betaproteobacteria bacterium]|nr:ATP-binding cassette domain-containing protein [Betaproteobacteria bacterium]PWB65131.1 MAG: ABC transporter ATP-binding protein [Betaproteobacteria bacterium]
MLRLSDITLSRGARVLLKGASLTVFPGHRVGLVGANGAGKSSLFALVLGELHQDAGEVELPARWVLSHVAQELVDTERAALDFVMDGDVELREVEAAIREAEAAHEEGERAAMLHARYDEIGGYAARSRAQALMSGLGFSPEAESSSVASFSGGWRMRLNLARALMCRSDLLLLDEPTNHLDLDAVLWLEDWLKAYPGALLLITHDREFLDSVVGAIVHVDAQKLTTYAGNYSAFERQRAERLAQQQAAFERQQRTRAHLQAFIDRFRAKATKARQAQSRIKALERLEDIAEAHIDSPFTFAFREPPVKPKLLFRVAEAAVGYGGKAVVSGVEWSVYFGEAIGLLGPNGAGKSTLLKTIVGDLPPVAGEIIRSPDIRIGYFAQHQVEKLRLEESALWHLARLAPEAREQDLRDFLGGFDFRGDQVFQKVESFSGGEKARLALALIVWERPNLLVLDEPTNHLDIEMREALAQALQDFEGTLIVVAHDRHLLEAATDQWWLVADGALAPFDGDLDDYREWSRQYRVRGRPEPREGAVDRKAQKRAEAEARQRLADAKKPFEKRIAAIERELDALQPEKESLDAWLASGDAYEEAMRETLAERSRRHGEVAARIAQLEEDWLWASAQMEDAVNRARE